VASRGRPRLDRGNGKRSDRLAASAGWPAPLRLPGRRESDPLRAVSSARAGPSMRRTGIAHQFSGGALSSSPIEGRFKKSAVASRAEAQNSKTERRLKTTSGRPQSESRLGLDPKLRPSFRRQFGGEGVASGFDPHRSNIYIWKPDKLGKVFPALWRRCNRANDCAAA
jgi:hypothetical protein